jgi:hypothetical protein
LAAASLLKNYKRVIEFDRNGIDGFAHQRLVDCFVQLDRLSFGIEYFRGLALSLANTKAPFRDYPASIWPHFVLGMLFVHSNDTKAALEEYKVLKAQGKGKPAELAEELFNAIYK